MQKIIINIIVLFLVTACSNSDTETTNYTDEYSTNSSIEYTVAIKNLTGRELKKARLLLYAPVVKTPNQKVIKLKIKQPHKVSRDTHGNQIISVSYEQAKPEMEDRITVSADVQMAATPNLIQSPDIASYRQIGRTIPSEEATQLNSTAQSLTAGDDVAATLRAITEWIETNLEVEKGDRTLLPTSSTTTLDYSIDIGRVSLVNKKGSLRGNANITLDMARSLGIPVRWVAGVLLKGSGPIKLENARLWLQYWDDEKWKAFDIVGKEEVKDYSKLLILRIFPGYLITEIEKPDQLLYQAIGISKQ